MDVPERSSRKTERTDPGASRHGNFMNYYQFHPAEERVRQLPRGVWQPRPDRKYVGLDVGCNAGDLTFHLHDFLREVLSTDDVSLIGIDLDPILIERARERNPRPDRVVFECLDFLAKEDESQTLEKHLASIGRARFDVVFCFSITMWIHLNHGDKGLVEFLRRACSMAETIVIEPQPWRCYREAARRLRRSKGEEFPLLKSLELRGEPIHHIENVLTEVCRFRKVLVTEGNNWQRKLLIYERTDG